MVAKLIKNAEQKKDCLAFLWLVMLFNYSEFKSQEHIKNLPFLL